MPINRFLQRVWRAHAGHGRDCRIGGRCTSAACFLWSYRRKSIRTPCSDRFLICGGDARLAAPQTTLRPGTAPMTNPGSLAVALRATNRGWQKFADRPACSELDSGASNRRGQFCVPTKPSPPFASSESEVPPFLHALPMSGPAAAIPNDAETHGPSSNPTGNRSRCQSRPGRGCSLSPSIKTAGRTLPAGIAPQSLALGNEITTRDPLQSSP